MDKITLKARLIKMHEETLQRLRNEYASYQSGGNLNLEEVRDADDNSHREQAEEYLQAMERQIHQRENEIRMLRDLDFGPKTTVIEGSVALVNGHYYIIGIPACHFEFEGKHFISMSPDAPFYQELMDRNQNDSFIFNNMKFTIESIF